MTRPRTHGPPRGAEWRVTAVELLRRCGPCALAAVLAYLALDAWAPALGGAARLLTLGLLAGGLSVPLLWLAGLGPAQVTAAPVAPRDPTPAVGAIGPAAAASRSEIEAQLAEQASLLHGFYDGCPIPMGMVELLEDDLFHISCNPAAEQAGNGSKGEVQRLRIGDLAFPREVPEEWLTHYRESERIGGPVRFASTPGEGRTLLFTICPIGRGEQGRTRFCYMAEDIMEQRRAEEERRRSEALFRAMSDASPLGIFLTDPAGDCLYASRAWQRIAGVGASSDSAAVGAGPCTRRAGSWFPPTGTPPWGPGPSSKAPTATCTRTGAWFGPASGRRRSGTAASTWATSGWWRTSRGSRNWRRSGTSGRRSCSGPRRSPRRPAGPGASSSPT